MNYFLVLILLINCYFVFGCNKVPTNVPYGAKAKGDNGYKILIGHNPKGYEPGKIYNIFLLGARTHIRLQQFTLFTLSAKAAHGPSRSSGTQLAGPKRVGRFQLYSDSLTKFNEKCVNTVSEADDLPKSEVQVMWVAPATNSGCVSLSAMVYENSNSWFSDDGALTTIICEDKVKESQPAPTECCACDEAKYNFIFEGIWSNETHPKDYPFAVWLTHFSDVIGASHEANYSFWGENHIASDGFRSLAEWGSIRLLEQELRAKGPKLRSLIKAGGLWYPNVNANTSSQFKVDRIHHKVSLASMFGPSPDWVVGVNGLNLCMDDCSWKDSLTIDLYPWDAGTDSGISYMSPNAETQPRERMHAITTLYPEDPRAPFYNPKARSMIPLAKLYITREKLIHKDCDANLFQSGVLDESENTEESERPECSVTSYTNWSPCSVTCGKGLRTRSRSYVNRANAAIAQCNRQLISKEMCVADIPECENTTDSEDSEENLGNSAANVDAEGEGVGVCRTTRWSVWSECSATCGIGISMRTRTFIDHKGRKKCPHISIVEKEKCMRPECSLADIELPDSLCPVTPWSDWSPCSASCGKGVKIRTRLPLVEPHLIDTCSKRIELNQQQACSERQQCVFDIETTREICSLEVEKGPCRGNYQRFAFSPSNMTCVPFIFSGCRGNQNNFLTATDCMVTCKAVKDELEVQRSPSTQSPQIVQRRPTSNPNDLLPVDCVLSDWTDWTACSVACGMGKAERYRNVLVEPRNGGLPCPTRTLKRKKCFAPPCL